MERRDFLIGAGGVALGATGMSAILREPEKTGAAAKSAPPNFLILLADDLRWDGVGVSGNRLVRTPRIDDLAANAAVFRNAFVTTSVCPTSRASIMLGELASRHGIWDFQTPFDPSQFERTYHRALKATGYEVGFVGKWGLGGDLPVPEFDYFDGFTNLGHYNWPSRIGDRHLTAHHGDSAISFLENRSPDRPFCLTVSYWAPHAQSNQEENEVPFDPLDADLYQQFDFPLAPTFSSVFAERLPAFMREPWAKTQFQRRFTSPDRTQAFIKGYYRLVSGMDRSIGRILDALDQTGARDNTVVVFLSDNGFMLGEHGFVGKWLIYEESIRIPLIIQLPPSLRGAPRRMGTQQSFALNIDVAPTVLALAGVEPSRPMDGRDLFGDAMRESFHYEYKLAPFFCLGVRTREWKYAWYPKEDQEQLFHLNDDPFERTNLAGLPRVASLQTRLRAELMDHYGDSELLEGL